MSKKLAIAMFGQKRLSREGGVEIVVKELCTRMAQNGCDVTCYNRAGHHVSGAEYDDAGKTEYEGIRQKAVPTIERRGLAAVSSSAFAALYSAFGKYDVVHIHAEEPAFFCWLPKLFGKRVVVTIHGIDWQREKWQSGLGSKFIHQGEKNAVKYADDPLNYEDVKKCMKRLHAFHDLKLKVNHEFDIFGQMEFYETLWEGMPSVYKDYEKTKANVLSLKSYIDAHAGEKVLTHIDAVPDNFLFVEKDGKEEIRLIDWEYAGMQDCFLRDFF